MKTNIILLLFSLLSFASFSQQVCVTIIGNPANTQIADIISSSPSVTNTSEQTFSVSSGYMAQYPENQEIYSDSTFLPFL